MIFAHITLPLLCSFTELFICVKPDERIINHVIRKGENTEEFQVFDETLRFDCLTVLLRLFIHLRKIFEWTDKKTLLKHWNMFETCYFVISYAFYVSIYQLIDHCLVGLLWSAVLYYVVLFAATKGNEMKKGFGFVPLRYSVPHSSSSYELYQLLSLPEKVKR